MKRGVILCIWGLVALPIWTLVCKLVNQPDTLLMYFGFILAILFIAVSIRTKCFTCFIKNKQK